MKRFLSFLMVLCLALTMTSVASAAAKLRIIEQPVSQTVKAGGSATFTVKAKGVGDASITWYFTNPLTGESTTGRKLTEVFKGLKVKGPNSLKITLSMIPESMHGWTLHCHIGPKSGGVSSDTVMILIQGLEPPVLPTPTPTPKPSVSGAPSPYGSSDSSGSSSKENSSAPGQSSVVAVKEPVVIKGSSKFELYALDGKGNVTGSAQTELKFPDGKANFFVQLPEGTEGTIQYVKIDSVRLTPTGDLTGLSVRGWDHSSSVSVKVLKPGSENGGVSETMQLLEKEREAEKEAVESVDTSSLVNVTCTNCRFSGWNYSFAESGQVPVGTTITVVSSGGWIKKGYSVNGAKAAYKNQASFQMVVEGETSITMEKQK